MLAALVDRGFLQVDQGRYSLSPEVFRIRTEAELDALAERR